MKALLGTKLGMTQLFDEMVTSRASRSFRPARAW